MATFECHETSIGAKRPLTQILGPRFRYAIGAFHRDSVFSNLLDSVASSEGDSPRECSVVSTVSWPRLRGSQPHPESNCMGIHPRSPCTVERFTLRKKYCRVHRNLSRTCKTFVI